MSKDYSPDELIGQRFHQFKDAWLIPDWKLVRLNHGPKLPKAEKLNIPRDSRHRTIGQPIEAHPFNGVELLSPKRDFGRVPSDGVSSGMAINRAHPTARRMIKVGREQYEQRDENGKRIMVRNPITGGEMAMPEQVLREIPVGESAWVHHGQWPEFPHWDDRSACWVADDGSIWAVWRWTPNPNWVLVVHEDLRQWVNNAATWGRFNSRGELLEGSGGSTALGDPWVCTTITPDMIGGPPVLLSGFLGLYAQKKRDGSIGDGLLEEPGDDFGLRCGDVHVWKENAQLIRTLTSLGPTNEWIAECLVTCGFVVNDQAGSKVPIQRDSSGKIPRHQLDPKAPAVRVQACSDWETPQLRDIRNFQFSLEEAHLANEQHIEFRTAGDPHTPFTQTEEPEDPRIAQVHAASDQYTDVIYETLVQSDRIDPVLELHDSSVKKAIQTLNGATS